MKLQIAAMPRFFRRFAAMAAILMLVPASAVAGDRPNVLFIAVDDLNSWVNCYGNELRAATPNIDRLASRGVRFDRAYCAAPICNPSRVAVMFGMNPASTGIYLISHYARDSARLKEALTLPQQFRQAGYEAIGCGKIFHTMNRAHVWNDPQSWDDYAPGLGGSNRKAHPSTGFEPGELVHMFDWGPINSGGTTDADTKDFKDAEWIAERIRRPHDKPFFYAYGCIRPHLPLYVPQKYFDMYPLEKITLPKVLDNDLDDVPEAGRRIARNDAISAAANPDGSRDFHRELVAKGKWREAVQAYLAAITFADAAVGVVLDALAASPEADNTIVVLWGDHGWHLGEKNHWQKCTLWEESARVPLIMLAPGVAKPGGVCQQPVNLTDIYPTLLEMCGLAVPSGLDGRSLVPLLEDPAASWPHAALTTYNRGNHAVRTAGWTLIRYADGSMELYDRQADPHEWHNLAGDSSRASIVSELSQYLPAADAPAVRRTGYHDERFAPKRHTGGKPLPIED